MYLDRSPQQQAGAGLPIALFIVTVLSLMVLGMSQLQESTGKSISLQIQSQRAFFAAESGAQVAVASVLPADKKQGVSCSDAPTASPITFSNGGLGGCEAAISCTAYTGVLTLQSTGQCGGGVGQASRVVRVRLQ